MNRLFHFMIACGCLLLFAPASVVLGISLSIEEVPTILDQNQEAEIHVQITCSSCTSNSYIRGVFYASGTSYFGYTQNKSGELVNGPGSSCDKYFLIAPADLMEGSWSGKLKIKPDSSSPLYNGPGEYMFKVARYPDSCSNPVWSPEKIIAISGPSHTPTPTHSPMPSHTPTSIPSPTATVTPIPNSPTNSIVPVITPVFTPVPSSTPSVIPDADEYLVEEYDVSTPSSVDVLGDVSIPNQESDSIPVSQTKGVLKPYIYSSLFIAIGLALLSGILAWMRRNEYVHETQ